MSGTPALVVDSVSKSYAVYSSNAARFARWFGVNARPTREHFAVHDVSFSVNAGQSVALIGSNGAGKSTLLKLITGTVRPTAGKVAVAGRLSAILELGLGFNPEFTGRQNVYMAGGLMGFSTAELNDMMPTIEAFSELGRFFEEPLRIYSSGMQARLAFGVATAVRPDVLIIDEVLAVGDSYFQHKSFDRIRQFKAQGTSLIFVSHSMGDVRELCEHVVLLEEGRIAKRGDPDEVIDYYNARVSARDSERLLIEQQRRDDGWLKTASGTEEVEILGVDLFDGRSGLPISAVEVGNAVRLVARLRAKSDVELLVVGFMLKDRTGHTVWGSNTWHTGQTIRGVKSGQSIDVALSFHANLGPGSYGVTCAAHGGSTHLESNFKWIDNVVVFEVVNVNKPRFAGSAYLEADFVVTHG